MTCKDCFHYQVCDSFGFVLDPLHGGVTCCDFKTKADVVEVVRCKDCKHSRICVDNDGVIMCILDSEKDEETDIDYGFLSFHSENHYCSYGKRKKVLRNDTE